MSSMDFLSSDKQLYKGFCWARSQALEYVRDRAEAGPCYEAALPGRDAFCMRDASHQAGGAHCLGLQKHNRNMMRLFASNISPGRDFCSYWEITSRGLPAQVDYTDDSDFWYNLPANFDVTDACSRLYDLTGDSGYLLDPEMNSMERTVMPPSRMERGNTIIMEMTPGRMEAVSTAAPHTVRPGKVQEGAIPTEDHPTALPEGEQAADSRRCGRRKEISGRSFRSF